MSSSRDNGKQKILSDISNESSSRGTKHSMFCSNSPLSLQRSTKKLKRKRRHLGLPTTPSFIPSTKEDELLNGKNQQDSGDFKVIWKDSPVMKEMRSSGRGSEKLDSEIFAAKLAQKRRMTPSPEQPPSTNWESKGGDNIAQRNIAWALASTLSNQDTSAEAYSDIPDESSWSNEVVPNSAEIREAEKAQDYAHEELMHLLDKMDAEYSDSETQKTPVRKVRRKLVDTPVKPEVAAAAQAPSVDFFNGDDDFDFDAIDCDMLEQQAVETLTQRRREFIPNSAGGYHRFLVLEKRLDQMHRHLHLRVLCEADETAMELKVILKEDWYDTVVSVGDTMNIVYTFEGHDESRVELDNESDALIVDNSQHLVVVQPDILVSPTSVTTSFGCLRRATIQSCLRVSGPSSKKALLGTIKHELFERSLRWKKCSLEFFRKQLAEVIQENMLKLVETDLSEAEVLTDAETIYKDIQKWIRNFFSDFSQDNVVEMTAGNSFNQCERISIKRVLATEEMIWSCKWGVKGAIDATVEAEISDQNGSKKSLAILPLELKTGQRKYSEVEHRGQVMLYTLLLDERYKRPGYITNRGLLLYLPGPQTLGVYAHDAHIRALLQSRNRIAATLSVMQDAGNSLRGSLLPPMIHNERDCSRCFQSSVCLLYNAAVEGGTAETGVMAGLFAEKLHGVSSSQMAYFSHWNRLIDIETRRVLASVRDLWLQPIEDRMAEGKCVGNLKMVSMKPIGEHGLQYETIFSRKGGSNAVAASSTNSQFHKGDHVIISLHDSSSSTGHCIFHVCRGKILELSQLEVKLHLPTGMSDAIFDQNSKIKQAVWRLDKDVLLTGLNRAKDYLLRLFVNQNSPSLLSTSVDDSRTNVVWQNYPDRSTTLGDARLRSLIIDLKPPRFVSQNRSVIDKILTGNSQLQRDYKSLNFDQQKAFEKVYSALDYCLILGMPGTGKTFTISFTVRMLLELGYSVLVTSYTHAAVDNLLLKLMAYDLPILRLGSPTMVHPEIRRYTLDVNENMPIQNVKEMQQKLLGAKLVGTTCLGVNHACFLKRRFDYCILDEAGQVTQPVTLGPIAAADTFVLVGDHYQLPPLVADNQAKSDGMDISVFRRLSEAHPSAVQNLSYQYRMNQEIMEITNNLVYGNKLRCGRSDIQHQRLRIPNWKQLSKSKRSDSNNNRWILDILNPENPVTFVNTDSLAATTDTAELEERSNGKTSANAVKHGGTIFNRFEAVCISILAKYLFRDCQFPVDDIGVISPYRSQTRLLSKVLPATVDVSTIDKYQGKDKQVIFISLVRSNTRNRVGDLLQDWRRLNVAFTRAKCKLVIFGSAATMAASPLFTCLLSLVRKRKWIYELPPDCFELLSDDTSHQDRYNVERQMLNEYGLNGTHLKKTVESNNSSSIKIELHHQTPKTTKDSNNCDENLDIENIVPLHKIKRSAVQLQSNSSRPNGKRVV